MIFLESLHLPSTQSNHAIKKTIRDPTPYFSDNVNNTQDLKQTNFKNFQILSGWKSLGQSAQFWNMDSTKRSKRVLISMPM